MGTPVLERGLSQVEAAGQSNMQSAAIKVLIPLSLPAYNVLETICEADLSKSSDFVISASNPGRYFNGGDPPIIPICRSSA